MSYSQKAAAREASSYCELYSDELPKSSHNYPLSCISSKTLVAFVMVAFACVCSFLIPHGGPRLQWG